MSDLKSASEILKGSKSRDRRPTSPGEILRDEFLKENNVTQDEFARAIGRSRLTVNQLIKGKRSITAEMALRLARATSTDPNFWLDLQRNIDLYEARKNLGDSLNKIKVVLAPVTREKLFYDLP